MAADDKVSGSLFWTTPVDCYVSGDGNCPPPSGSGIGYDGCPVEWAPLHDNQLLTLDTEPDALRHRWAWGFGHLRRAVATLGLITGKLNGMMSVSSWIPVASSGINRPSSPFTAAAASTSTTACCRRHRPESPIGFSTAVRGAIAVLLDVLMSARWPASAPTPEERRRPTRERQRVRPMVEPMSRDTQATDHRRFASEGCSSLPRRSSLAA